MMRCLFVFMVMLCCQQALAGDTLRSIPVKAHYITTDESGNAYVVRNDNVLIRYNDYGDSTGFYNSVLNGEIGSVDALNRLRVFIFYPDYSRIVWLDQTMNPQAEADLKKLGIPSGALAAPSSDNNIWVYDSYSAMLRKIDENGVVQRTSNDLRQQLDFVPEGVQLMERERKVFLVDSSRGVLVFDQFGSYLAMLPIKGISHLEVPFADQLLTLLDGGMYSFNLKTNLENTTYLKWPNDSHALSIAMSRTNIIALFSDRIRYWPIGLLPGYDGVTGKGKLINSGK